MMGTQEKCKPKLQNHPFLYPEVYSYTYTCCILSQESKLYKCNSLYFSIFYTEGHLSVAAGVPRDMMEILN